ncbi:MAG: hypothetical protein M3N68_14370 [Actinomycetota bacterium]|nr:hypothetical protein [Actinomycetota bacterium]
MAHLRGAVVRLEDARALDEATTGGKAAALARAAWAQLPVLPGFVLTTAATALVDETGDVAALGSDVERAWAELSEDGRRALVVRSSSTVEDLADSSMAGRFKSVVGVKGLEPFLEAVKVVLDSRREAARGDTDIPADHPIAVLVQPLLEARCGGVMFGVDPVTGREDRIVVSAVEGGPDRLVSGEVDATRYELDPKGRVRSCQERPGGASLGRRQRRRLAELARRAALVFDGPQDIEWALDGDGRLWLLQSRPVTTEVSGTPSGALLGPGPVAETFPEPLSRLEEDLWVEPLRRALREALLLAGSASRRDLEASPLAVCVGGRVAVDLSLFGAGSSERSMWRRIDPRPKLHRLPAAWRVGRLRSALPGLGADLVAKTDAELAGIPPLDELTDRQLVTLLERGAQALVALHAHEILVGVLVDPGAPRLTGTSVALRVLARSRQEGLADEEIVVRHPVVLALVPPHVRPVAPLPAEVDAPPEAPSGDADDLALLREALRLRVRWLQELTGRAAWELAGASTTEASSPTRAWCATFDWKRCRWCCGAAPPCCTERANGPSTRRATRAPSRRASS